MDNRTLNPKTVWSEFIEKLRTDTLTESDCMPIDGHYHGLYVLRPEFSESRKALYSMPIPEWEYGEDRLIFFVQEPPHFPRPLRFDFVFESGHWFIKWVEGMTLPIKKIDELPFNDFPELDQFLLGMAHADIYYTQRAITFVRIKEDESLPAALSFFEDNLGSNSGAWLPYFKESKSLVLLLAWIERRLNHETVSIERFSERDCIVRYHNHIWFRHYQISTHMREIITKEDHRLLFEHVWKTRAAQGGWTTKFEYVGHDTIVHLTQ